MTWLIRTEKFLHGAQVFFNNSVMFEAACQASGNCNNDQRSFKAYLSRFLSLTSIMAPPTFPTIRKYLETSAVAAAQSCSGGSDGHTCGTNWFYSGWDGKWGLGEQMSALEVIQNLVAPYRAAPFTANTGGSSYGDGGAGAGKTEDKDVKLDLGKGDTAGAALITCIIGGSIIGLTAWLILG
ncbi:unnamed protein product [Ambrosiozyma monospora]|uniref:Unnamed protein product n=1 Tax=Ambrosiozyma monospora TaxID=43982 RepID=A0ACB5TD81_AMBMO|nr:unnamed protein product [Ambrosiozyma monospora]